VTGTAWRRSRKTVWPASAAAGLALDAIFGDDPLRPHPVALYGRAMQAVERSRYDDTKGRGVQYALAGIGLALSAGRILEVVPCGAGATAASYTAIAGKGLWVAAAGVGEALELGDLERARGLLPALVGRDATHLDESGIVRAAVESVAENTVDGIVAPALFASGGGAAGVLGYRALNTLDSMVGHRSDRYRHFGWASARLDDAANFVPARVTALLVALVRPAAARRIWQAVRHDAPAHPSPNAGVAEAAFAGALGLRLGGTNSYGGRVEERPPLGPTSGRAPKPPDIARAIACSRHVTAALFTLLAGAAAAAAGAERRAER
jgi:adenosylcobinamide-phosphate synthase